MPARAGIHGIDRLGRTRFPQSEISDSRDYTRSGTRGRVLIGQSADELLVAD